MKKTILLFILTFILVGLAKTQTNTFDIASIPDSMKKNANTVVREEQKEFEVVAVDKAYLKEYRAVTILDESGNNELELYEYVNKFRSLENATVQIFDKSGVLVHKYTIADFDKEVSGSGLVPDGKVYAIKLPTNEYPVTVVSNYIIKYNGIWSYPSDYIQRPKQSVIHSVFNVKVPKDLDVRFKAKNTNILPIIASNDFLKTYKWDFYNLTAKDIERGIGLSDVIFPKILLAPNKVEYSGYPGDVDTWKNMGIWYNNLVKTDNSLSPENAVEIKQLTNGITDDREKIKILYQYLQKNFRYVSIQLGIGGFKPFSADFVHKNKYGDCKALSNYMQACLSAVNIKGYSAWIYGNMYPNIVDPDFVSDDFNHQILCVPSQKDTLWLECTSNISEFGVLGAFTENRKALLLKEDGGVLINTPISKSENNIFKCSSTINLKEDGSGNAVSTFTTSGEFRDEFEEYFFEQKKDDEKRYIVYRLGFLQPDEFEITYDKLNKQSSTNLKMEFEKISAFSAGDKIFLNPRIYKIWSQSLPNTEHRIQDYYFEYPFIKYDTTIYNLPDGFIIENLPKPKEFKFEYGNFKSSYQYDATKKSITNIIRFELKANKIPTAKFQETKLFFNQVSTEYEEKLVIKKT